MSKQNTLVLAGGEVHDYKSTGPAIMDALSECEDLSLTYIEDDLDALVSPNLDPYDLLVFYYTVGEISDPQKNGLLNWVASGKGYAGVHSAADSFHSCPEYRAMVGGHFVTHPRYRDYQVSVVDPEHEITEGLTEFSVTDEQYILDYDSRNHVLCSALHEGHAMPVAWTKGWGEGRVFYLALGHDGEACKHDMFRTILQKGARWACRTEES